MNVYIPYDTYKYFHEDTPNPIILKSKEEEIKPYINNT
jgi:hypothetical protein